MMTSTSTFKIVDYVTSLKFIKEDSRAKHSKLWREYKDYVHQSGTSIDWEVERPKEEDVLGWVRYLRNDRKAASSSMWTYSHFRNIIL